MLLSLQCIGADSVLCSCFHGACRMQRHKSTAHSLKLLASHNLVYLDDGVLVWILAQQPSHFDFM